MNSRNINAQNKLCAPKTTEHFMKPNVANTNTLNIHEGINTERSFKDMIAGFKPKPNSRTSKLLESSEMKENRKASMPRLQYATLKDDKLLKVKKLEISKPSLAKSPLIMTNRSRNSAFTNNQLGYGKHNSVGFLKENQNKIQIHDNFFYLNDKIKECEQKYLLTKVKQREVSSSKVFNKIESINKFSEKEKLITKLQSLPTNLYISNPDYRKIKANEKAAVLIKIQDAIRDSNYKIHCDPKSEFITRNSKPSKVKPNKSKYISLVRPSKSIGTGKTDINSIS